MNTPFDPQTGNQDRIVYVRPVDITELPENAREAAAGLDHIYALHAPDGERLALVRDRELAFALARQNDFSPVTVH